jgi:hypothetical protein
MFKNKKSRNCVVGVPFLKPELHRSGPIFKNQKPKLRRSDRIFKTKKLELRRSGPIFKNKKSWNCVVGVPFLKPELRRSGPIFKTGTAS